MKRAEWLKETRKVRFEEAARLVFQALVLVAFCLRTINLRTICESSRFLRINLNLVMGYTSQLNVINI
jgi:NADPH-dependent glutamate synthase beta subunit-like oxidoreductase